MDSMLQRECNQMGIMDKIPGHSALLKHFAQDCLMGWSFRKNANDRRLQECAQRFHGFDYRGRRIKTRLCVTTLRNS